MSEPMSLIGQVRELAELCRAEVPTCAAHYTTILDRIDEPLRVAIAGKVKAGKSTLLNALLGAELAASDAGECTRIVTWYQHGDEVSVHGETQAGRFPLPFSHEGGKLDIDLDGRDPDDFKRLVVAAPLRDLAQTSLIDTPGMASLSTDIASKSTDFLTPEDGQNTVVDAVIYLLRHLHATDVSFLHAFHDREFASPSPVNCLGVLSRADEVAVGRLDAMDSARKIASRYSTDPRLRRLVQGVVPVAGLIGQASSSLTDGDAEDLRAIAQLDAGPAQLALLSIDRFLTDEALSLAPSRRQDLLDRLGLFGLRLVESNLRSGLVSTTEEIRGLLRDESGITHLADTLAVVFGGRRDTLKARSALVAIERLMAAEDHPREATARLERIWASAHDFAELRTLNVIRDADIGLQPEQMLEAERALGGFGTLPYERAGLDADCDDAEVRQVLLEIISRWRAVGANPIADRSVTALSDVVIRSCEGTYARLA